MAGVLAEAVNPRWDLCTIRFGVTFIWLAPDTARAASCVVSLNCCSQAICSIIDCDVSTILLAHLSNCLVTSNLNWCSLRPPIFCNCIHLLPLMFTSLTRTSRSNAYATLPPLPIAWNDMIASDHVTSHGIMWYVPSNYHPIQSC